MPDIGYGAHRAAEEALVRAKKTGPRGLGTSAAPVAAAA